MKRRKNAVEHKTINQREKEATFRNVSLSGVGRPQAKGDNKRTQSPHPRSSATGELFPPYFIYVVVLLTLLSRVNIAINPGSWWILHPDEVYQSLEVAHSELYGYGFRPYEFLEPPRQYLQTTSSEKQHEALGMYSMRSWLHARLYLLLFYIADKFSITTGRFVLAKTTHSVICGFLPLVIFHMLRVMNPLISQDVFIMVAILVSSSDYVVVLGTHTLINSLLSPLVFLTVTLCLGKSCQELYPDVSILKENVSSYRTNSQHKEIVNKRSVISWPLLSKLNYRFIFVGVASGILIYIRPDSFFIILIMKITFASKLTFISVMNYVAGFITGIIIGGYDDYISYKIWFISPFQWLCFQLKYAGILFGRQDIFFYAREIFFHSYTMTTLSLLLIMTLLLYMLNMWHLFPLGSPLHQWCEDHLNILQLTSRLFSVSVTLLLFYSFQQHKEIRFVHDPVIIFLCSAACSVFCLHQLIQRLLSSTENSNLSNGLRFLLYAELCLYAVQNHCNYPSSLIHEMPKNYTGPYQHHLESGRVNMCLDFINHQPDATGLVIDYSIYLTGGYTILHKDIPIFAKTHYEFREWKHKDRQILLSKPYFGNAKNVSVALVDKVSNFITIENSRLLLKTVANNSEYNYVIVTDGRKFPKKGYKEVFTIGSVSVYKRLRTRHAVEYLKTVAEDISIGDNSTLLQYEASWLLTLGLLTHAKERLERALQINSECTRCWQLLYVTLQRLDPQKARLIPPKCYKIVGKEKCDKPTEKIVLHPEYKLGLNFPTLSL